VKVLFINRYAHPDPSGNSRMLTDLTADLSKAGHRVTVIASDAASVGAAVAAFDRGASIFRVHETSP